MFFTFQSSFAHNATLSRRGFIPCSVFSAALARIPKTRSPPILRFLPLLQVSGYKLYPVQCAQVEQPEEGAQEPHELPPPMGEETPPAPLEKDAKDETSLLALRLHLGHSTSSLAWLKERNKSNLLLQPGQQYS